MQPKPVIQTGKQTRRQTARRFKWGIFLAAIATLSAIPALANKANFDKLTLSPGFEASTGVVSGFTGGSTSLPAIVANRDRDNNPCLGFGDPNPDHVMELQRDFSRLRLEVNSRGHDTTLLIQGPDNKSQDNNAIRCGDDTDSSRDASIEDTNWKAGTYKIWVGSMEAGFRRNYTLTVRE